MGPAPKGITYREDFKAWWPLYDHKPEACFARVSTRVHDLDRTIGLCKRHRVCVQAGGHAGLWPKRLARTFAKVYTFECEPALYECLTRNVTEANVIPSYYALGDHVGEAKMLPHVSAGSWRIDEAGTLKVSMMTIDTLSLPVCDAIVLDVEGHEPAVLQGARETIKRYSPVIHVEELPRSLPAIRETLRSFGYRFAARVHSDCIYVRH